MSDAKHTPEPWFYGGEDGTHQYVPDPTNHDQAWAYFIVPVEDYRRAIPCVNACAGINPEAVPGLLAACKALSDGHRTGRPSMTECVAIARTAITKANTPQCA